MMRLDQDTIVAISTPPGRGGIGVVRLSGPQALAIASTMVRGPLRPGKANITHILDDSKQVLDEAVVTYFAAPASYTTEDVVEVSAHGAPVLLNYLVQSAIREGARLAQPGEFTQRAFLAGRLDLTQAEAVHDLVAANTLHQVKTAAAQAGGAIAHAVAPSKQRLIELIATLEAGVDFAEDELDLLPEADIVRRIAELEHPLCVLAASYSYGRIVREGLTMAVVGAPNAGKSSLFNRLLERERAIVTASPGTTRDTISEQLVLDGIPINLVDTAGLRELPPTPETEAERAGIERSGRTLADADLVLHVIDCTTLETSGNALSLRPEDIALQAKLQGRPSLLIYNKLDLAPIPRLGLAGAVAVSALTGSGLDELRKAILNAVAAQPAADTALITSLRQSKAISSAVQSLAKARAAASDHYPQEFLLLDLHDALIRLDELTGATTPDAILTHIFSTFCIGK